MKPAGGAAATASSITLPSHKVQDSRNGGFSQRNETGRSMEVDQIQCKYQRIGGTNGRLGLSNKLGQNHRMEDRQYPDEEDVGERKGATANGGGGRGGGGFDLAVGGGIGRFYGWPSSRIVRVSRASGGKDRHSKVLTSKGLRDRRVRLSVNTAIQFYDLQDRLGYDQPSKAVEWLLKAAASSIAELPPMNNLFPDTPRQASDEKRSSNGGSGQLFLESADVEINDCGGDPSYHQQKQATKSSACSSNSETSKNSDLSLSRSDIRFKAKAKGKVAEPEKDKEVESLNPISLTTSFTELLSGGLHNVDNSPNSSVHQTPNRGGGNTIESNFFLKSPSTSMDYFTSALLGPTLAAAPPQMQFVNACRPLFSLSGDHGSEIQSFAFAPEHFSVAGGGNNNHGSGGYNLNFTISSSPGLTGFNRGTLQSNSLPPVQRFSPTDGSPPNYFIGATAEPVENQHQFHSGFDGRLQLYYGNDRRHSGGQKGKEKN